MKTLEITFSVQGFVRQHVTVPDNMTAEKLQELLNSGKAMTSIQEDGQVVGYSEDKEGIIGNIVYVDNECEYNEFEVTEQD